MKILKGKRVKAVDGKGKPRPVKGYNSWFAWKSPTNWTTSELAGLGHRPGVYMLRAVTAPGRAVEFPVALGSDGSGATPDDLKKRAKYLQGVLYIGKAVDLTHRFGGMLVPSWRSDPPTPGHTSARNYLRKDALFRQQYPGSRVEVTCMPIGSKDWSKDALSGGLLDLPQSWFWTHYPHWTQGHGNDEMDQTCAAVIDHERSLLCLYRKTFGDFPPLNKRTPNSIGAKLDPAWIDKFLMHGIDPAQLDPAADAVVEMGDPAGPMVQKSKAKYGHIAKKPAS